MQPWIADEKQWAETIFGGCDLRDKRRTKRLVEVAAAQAACPEATTYESCQGDGAELKGAYRLYNNDAIDPEWMTESGIAHTVELCRNRELIVIPEDTTTATFTHDLAKELGDVGGAKGTESSGYHIHSSLAVDPHTKEVLGLLAQNWWVREDDRPGRDQRMNLPYEEKESYKWQQGTEDIRRYDLDLTKAIWVCDREADIHDYMQDKLEHNERFVIRASNNRILETPEGKLWDFMWSMPVVGISELELEQHGKVRSHKPRDARKYRNVELEVRIATVTLAASDPYRNPTREPITVNVVFLHEKNPKSGVEPISWMLLTTEPVANLQDAKWVAYLYGLRWHAEQFHKSWKTGCKAEERRFQSPEGMQRLLTVLSFIAVRILQLKTYAEAHPDAPCDKLLTEAQWKCLYAYEEPRKRIPRKPPSIKWAHEAIARLGGWTDSKRTGKIGWIILWRGWEKLDRMALGWELAKKK